MHVVAVTLYFAGIAMILTMLWKSRNREPSRMENWVVYLIFAACLLLTIDFFWVP